jgi:hypothetical protein
MGNLFAHADYELSEGERKFKIKSAKCKVVESPAAKIFNSQPRAAVPHTTKAGDKQRDYNARQRPNSLALGSGPSKRTNAGWQGRRFSKRAAR